MRKLATEELIARKGNIDQLKTRPLKEVYLILDNIRSMYNVGAIFRTADAAGIKKIFLCGITATPPRKEIEKTALKTIDFVPWEYFKSTTEIIFKLKEEKVAIVALEQTNKSQDYHTFSYKEPIAIVIGHETEGIDQEVLDLCDDAIEIPMHGISNSLNVATAAGIVLFETIK